MIPPPASPSLVKKLRDAANENGLLAIAQREYAHALETNDPELAKRAASQMRTVLAGMHHWMLDEEWVGFVLWLSGMDGGRS